MERQLWKKVLKCYDYPLVTAVIMLSLFGLIMVYSSSMVTAVIRFEVPSDYFYERQKRWLIAALVAFAVMAMIPYKVWRKERWVKLVFFASPLMLVAVAFLGHTANNATSWFRVGALSVQPAELAKLGLILYLAAAFANKQKRLAEPVKSNLFPIYYTLFICFLIAIQPDFGTAAIVFFIAMCIIVSSGLRLTLLLKQLLFFTLIGAVLSPFWFPVVGEKIFSDERMSRLYSYLDPFQYASSDGYQLVNSYLAIGLGGLKGLGLGKGVQKYGYLPESHTDFIMAVIAEELGLFGVMFTLGLLSFIVLRGFWIARRSNDAFGSLLAIGISVMIGFQTFINVGGVTGLIPITGVPLPLVSYGGTSLVLMMASLGLLVNISMFTKYEQRYKKGEKMVADRQKKGLTF
ncbi:putative lipid II flippase FtsW [Geobacillus sp. 46C-IIa]|uniref:putative lipid II flippase FtsW n=1 Tax=Geobacillus sp. 46C-IIa TaxID=1963025 RepID=UPI0009BE7BBF|nr:putative lipid II flippase FtsW [Geobacillus sp. 46C-IIa]OQP07860.1 putative lipid II flippase FtsW [Geobacillus sp. 46C-IIa]QNU26980.1 putative lipid II flippase FtsW [Geobacillus sp. 46C-IIa]